MKVALKELLEKILASLTSKTLLTVTGSLSVTTYTLNGNISDYRMLIVTALSSYSNRWTTAIDTKEFIANTQAHYLSLGTEFAVYNLSLAYVSQNQVRVVAKGSSTNGMIITGIR